MTIVKRHIGVILGIDTDWDVTVFQCPSPRRIQEECMLSFFSSVIIGHCFRIPSSFRMSTWRRGWAPPNPSMLSLPTVDQVVEQGTDGSEGNGSGRCGRNGGAKGIILEPTMLVGWARGRRAQEGNGRGHVGGRTVTRFSR